MSASQRLQAERRARFFASMVRAARIEPQVGTGGAIELMARVCAHPLAVCGHIRVFDKLHLPCDREPGHADLHQSLCWSDGHVQYEWNDDGAEVCRVERTPSGEFICGVLNEVDPEGHCPGPRMVFPPVVLPPRKWRFYGKPRIAWRIEHGVIILERSVCETVKPGPRAGWKHHRRGFVHRLYVTPVFD